jgi:hypothetical protein
LKYFFAVTRDLKSPDRKRTKVNTEQVEEQGGDDFDVNVHGSDYKPEENGNLYLML